MTRNAPAANKNAAPKGCERISSRRDCRYRICLQFNLSNAVVTTEIDTMASVTGNANTIALAPNAADQINLSGTGETVTGNSGSDLVLLDDTGTSVTVNGDGFVNLLASGQTLTLNDAGASINTFNVLSGVGSISGAICRRVYRPTQYWRRELQTATGFASFESAWRSRRKSAPRGRRWQVRAVAA